MLRTVVSAIACLTLLGGQAIGQSTNPLPQGNITIVVPLAAGGPADTLARTLAEKLGLRIGRTVLVENKPGAAGNIGAATVSSAPANGSTWLFTVNSVVTVNPHLSKTPGFDATKDLVPAARVGGVSLILAVNAKRVPAKSFSELLEYSKTHPVNFGSAGIGSPGHLAFEYLRMRSGIKGTHVPYRGAALVMNDLLAGQIEAAFVAGGALVTQVKAGTLRALAVSSATRNPQLPDVPTAIEAGVTGFDAVFSNYLLAPAATRPAVLDFMAAQVKDVMTLPDVKERINALFMEPGFAGPAESQTRIVKDREKWGKVVDATGMKKN